MDGDASINQNPTPHLEDEEFIEVAVVRLQDLAWYVAESERQGLVIDGRVWMLAKFGINLASRL